MIISFSYIENVEHIKMVSCSATYGIGFLTGIVLGFCHLFGTQCGMYDKKIEKAKFSAAAKLMEKAKAAGATGIMNVNFQIHNTTIFASGIAYKEK